MFDLSGPSSTVHPECVIVGSQQINGSFQVMELTGRRGGRRALTDSAQLTEVLPTLVTVDGRTTPGVTARRRRLASTRDQLSCDALTHEA